MAYLESTGELYLGFGRENFINQLMCVNYGIMNNLLAMKMWHEAASAAEEVISLYRDTNHPMLGDLLRE